MVFDPAKKMHTIALHSHYFPENWRGREGSPTVVKDFGRLFQFRIVRVRVYISDPIASILIAKGFLAYLFGLPAGYIS